MTIDTVTGISKIKALMAHLDDRIEAALAAQEFSFSALTADSSGAELHYQSVGSGPDWRITFRLPPDRPAELHLRLAGPADPPVQLALRADGAVIGDLAGALALAMVLLDFVRQD